MPRFLNVVLQLFIVAWLAACAAVNPNPNIGMRTVDGLVQKGRCEEAIQIAEPAALRGEPWAQFRMGAILIDLQCPNREKTDEVRQKAINWLEKAACYQSKTDYERGDALAVGPVGFFNTRASSTNAASMLANIYINGQTSARAWPWLDHAAQMYEPGDKERVHLEATLKAIEPRIRPDVLVNLKGHTNDVCANVK